MNSLLDSLRGQEPLQMWWMPGLTTRLAAGGLLGGRRRLCGCGFGRRWRLEFIGQVAQLTLKSEDFPLQLSDPHVSLETVLAFDISHEFSIMNRADFSCASFLPVNGYKK